MEQSGMKWSTEELNQLTLRATLLPRTAVFGLASVVQAPEVGMFRGNHQTRVDEKFRLKLPAEFKRRVDEVYGPLFYITSHGWQAGSAVPDEGVGGDRSEDRAAGADGPGRGRIF